MFHTKQLTLKEIEVEDLLLHSSLFRSGSLTHLTLNDEWCLIAYAEMCAFFSSVNW